MKNNFLEFISENKLLIQNDKTLLAVSGGVDSVVMLRLFIQAKIPVGIAHCNFQLREEDSVGDEKFVAEMAQKYGIDFHTIRFNTKEYAAQHGISIQMAARDLRYDWFEQIRSQYNYTLIATAHHRDDAVETFLLNMLRKTGIAGLHGIKPKSGFIIRPMLFTSKKEITDYAKKYDIAYREDITNADDHYIRNYIRLHIIPDFQHLNPNFCNIMQDSMHIISKQEMLYKKYVLSQIQSIIKEIPDGFSIETESLKKLSYPDVHLFELLHPLGFNQEQINDLLNSIDSTEEKIFFSHSFRLLKTRTAIEWYPLHFKREENIIIENLHVKSFSKAGISINVLDNSGGIIFENNPLIAYLDADKLLFPMQVRHWKAGDYFYPFGGKGKKKLSDFFSEKKLNSLEKQTAKLLCNQNGDIVWVMGFRSDNRYKVRDSTKKILVCELNF